VKSVRTCKIIFILLIVTLGVGCAVNPVRRDLADYVNQGILNIAELEQKSLQRYASVTGQNYTTERRVYEALRDHVVPLYKRFVEGLRKIRPETEEVKKLHKIYIMGAEHLYEGFKTKMYGLEMKDEKIVLAANEKIQRGAVQNQKWRTELVALARKHGLSAEKKQEEKKWWKFF
jgi:hypothetical protein